MSRSKNASPNESGNYFGAMPNTLVVSHATYRLIQGYPKSPQRTTGVSPWVNARN